MKILNSHRILCAVLCLHLAVAPLCGEDGKGPSPESIPDLEGALDSDVSELGIEKEKEVIPADAPIDTATNTIPKDSDVGVSSDEELLIDPEPEAAPRTSTTASEPKESSPSAIEPAIPRDTAQAAPLFESEPVPPVSPRPTEAKRNKLSSTEPRSARNSITNLEFTMEGELSRIVVSSIARLQYREVRNAQLKQIVYFFENTETPNRLQRAYDTTEFPTPVSLFTILQIPNTAPPLTKLIVQLREDKAPKLTPNERGVVIEFPRTEQKGEQKLIIGDSDPKQATEENIYSGAQTFSGKTLARLEVKNSDVQDVLRLIAKSSGFNIVIGEDVGGKVGTLSLKDVPWDQAFALVLQTKKLGYIKQGNVIRVATLEGLNAEKTASASNEESKTRVEPLKTVLIPVSYATAAELSSRGKTFLTNRGTIDTDARTNTIIVKDVERAVTRIQKLFALLDNQPAKVSISAKFVELSNKFTRQVGFSRFDVAQNVGGINVTGASEFDSKATTSFSISAPNFANLMTTFRLGELEEKVKTLANPSVTVIANQKATIEQTVSFSFTKVTQVAGGLATTTVETITAKMALNVKPIVAGDGSIFLEIDLKNEVPTGKAPELKVDSRSINTQVLIDDGDTAVLGGIFQNVLSSNREGVPFLMRIPILGGLFSNSSVLDSKTEVFIFLTAKILNAEQTFKRTM